MSLPALAIPGQYLAPSSQYAPGPGTHLHAAGIYASIIGSVSTDTTTKPASVTVSNSSNSKSSNSSGGDGANANTSLTTNSLPEVDSVVLARVTRLQDRQATLEVVVVDDRVCRGGSGGGGFQGIVRKEDIRATEKDKIKIGECFRVGDIVRGVVISLGDQASYYISTASNEYGVVMAVSEVGNVMYPISWKEFRDPKTGTTERRKVAKPF